MSIDVDDERFRQAMQQLVKRLELSSHEWTVGQATGWVVVTVDTEAEPRAILNACGPYPDPQTALLAAAQMDSDDRRWEETGWKHEVVPLFAQ